VQLLFATVVIRRTGPANNSGFRYLPDENFLGSGWVYASVYLHCTC